MCVISIFRLPIHLYNYYVPYIALTRNVWFYMDRILEVGHKEKSKLQHRRSLGQTCTCMYGQNAQTFVLHV